MTGISGANWQSTQIHMETESDWRHSGEFERAFGRFISVI
jgi:hypothetical protein